MRFADVLVPDAVKRQLVQTVLSQRVSHAQLFYGMEGTHVLALALAYAQYINCPNRTEEDSCGVCPSCRQFGQLAHPDLHFYFPHPAGKDLSSYNFYNEWREMFTETNGLFTLNEWYRKIGMENKQGIINKDDIDLLMQQTALKSYESEYKVFIIWMVEKINGQIAPKLLKTLEEPDGKTLFLLITANYDQVLNTIVSRSQLLKINRFSTDELAAVIQRKKNCDYDTAHRQALMAENDLATALRIQERTETENEQFALFQEMMRYAYALYHPIRNFEFQSVIQWVGKMEALGRENQKQFLRYALGMIRKCMLKNMQLDQLVPSVPDEELWIGKFKPFIRPDNVSHFYTQLNTAVKQVEANANSKMLFTDLVFSIGKYLK
ncbi:MAG: hypothetical protein IKO59_04550 [Bacteroidales bacterium]|nr:hypothetical protein [Bacteroidales bacterium]